MKPRRPGAPHLRSDSRNGMREDTDVLIYATLFSVVFDLFDVLHFKMLSWIILYHLACAIYIFLRMVRHAGFKVVDNES